MDDMFDAVLHMEEQFVSAGRRKGENDGRRQGFHEGHELGLSKGGDIGMELGFYAGFVSTWLQLAEKYPDNFPARSIKSLNRLRKLLDAYPVGDAMDQQMAEKMQLIRAKFKVVISVLGVHTYFLKQEDARRSETGPPLSPRSAAIKAASAAQEELSF